MKNEIRFKNFLNTSLSSETYIILQVLFPKKKKTDPQNIRSFRQRENVISSIRCGGDRSRGLGRTDKCQPQNRNGKKRERETVKDFAEKTVQLYIYFIVR